MHWYAVRGHFNACALLRYLFHPLKAFASASGFQALLFEPGLAVSPRRIFSLYIIAGSFASLRVACFWHCRFSFSPRAWVPIQGPPRSSPVHKCAT
eukprot:NODE_2792_length_447_cov_364.298995_g2314_i0.p1 GENE.NODE_2792_length_447_cov_364.298995_g2314_i0~~NODE_2792_length_447_cov_364.298995_g2314_i0.p1  ORF type:complete len:96 (+),score=0.01 NODE_2792_length_447_cov_364.298995_g2314_i0:120-407(+)